MDQSTCQTVIDRTILGRFVRHQSTWQLSDLLGHSSIETTRIYLLASGEEHARQLEGLGLVQ